MRVDRHYYPHVTDKETETQESNDMPRPTDKPTEVELETKSSDLKLKSFYLTTGYWKFSQRHYKKRNIYLKELID